VGHIANNGLSALVYRDMFHCNFLLASGAVSLECFHLCSESPGEFVEGTFRAVLLWNIVHVIETSREIHRQHVDSTSAPAIRLRALRFPSFNAPRRESGPNQLKKGKAPTGVSYVGFRGTFALTYPSFFYLFAGAKKL
jgi:hypothetical protein